MVPQIRAVQDLSLVARVVRRRPLFYSARDDAVLDRPAHVRAGSGLTSVGDRLVVIQDDANFLALIEPCRGTVDAVALPAGPGGRRQFDDLRGNKHEKLDLEACVTMIDERGELFVAFASGSTSLRQQVLMIMSPLTAAPDHCLYDARGFYETLRSHFDFAGSDLNIEGVVHLGGDCLRLFQRGNGAPRNGRLPVNASCDISWRALQEHLKNPAAVPPAPRNIVQYQLGELDGVRLSFTDAAVHRSFVFYTAAAESSPDAVRDGPVAGSVLGLIRHDGIGRWAEFVDQNGDRLLVKVEGLSFDRHDQDSLWILIDQDDPAAPSELCEVELEGDWG